MNFDGLLDSRSPFALRCLPFEDRHGRDMLVAIAKLSYDVSPRGAVTLSHPPSPVRSGDVPAGEGAWSSVRYPSDLVDEKPGTDVVMLGTAHPRGAGVTQMDVSLRIETGRGTLQKTVRVFGPRVFMQGVTAVQPGRAAALGPTPLVYELAYGGIDDSDPDDVLIERRNPAGSGYARNPASLIGRPAPAIEDPAAPLGSRAPAPAGFGPVSASWEPRARLAGTYDLAWRRERAPIRPSDFDPRFNCFAPAGLYSEQPLTGDEPVEVLGATVEGVWRFSLPRHAPLFRASVRGVETEIRPPLDTFLIDADEGRVELTWRMSMPMPRRTQFLDGIEVYGTPALPDPIVEDLRRKIGPLNQTESLAERPA